MKKVLIVDDMLFMRNLLKTMLEENGFEVVAEAGDGLEAIEKYSEFRPDVVTMDITMKEMDGIEAIKGIREIDENCKVVVISALGMESMVMKAIAAGAKGFIRKPFEKENVIKTLNEI
ncbi:response regulator [Clostridium cylindrosporum]|uniref:Stage 0 sporulation protein A homolog n=1 Tax=Clostridium cylindrosporum DSM 605 TaxID=1121307 RepID=A0A0J8G2Q0_CLOCY|nr:response regulator [Clostridium cylindrosporum]KMT21996.1 chemotaxis protein CheY [Clostridium cylindrosporum DSM 605]